MSAEYTPEERAMIDRYESLRGLYHRRIETARERHPNSPFAALAEAVGDDHGDELDQTLVEMERELPESYVYPGDEVYEDK